MTRAGSRSVAGRARIQAFTFSSQDHGRLPVVHVSKHSCFVSRSRSVARRARVQTFVCVVCTVCGVCVLWCVLSCAGVVLCLCVGVEEKTHGPTRGRKTWHDTSCVDPHSKQQQTNWETQFKQISFPLLSSLSISFSFLSFSLSLVQSSFSFSFLFFSLSLSLFSLSLSLLFFSSLLFSSLLFSSHCVKHCKCKRRPTLRRLNVIFTASANELHGMLSRM